MDKASEDIVKIGVYEYEPFIMIDSNGNISGYYNDFFEFIEKKYNFKYEYVVCSLSEGLEKLENGEIDIMPGVTIIGNDSSIIYNKFTIVDEKFSIYSKKYETIYDLKGQDIIKLGLVRNDNNAEWILEFLKVNDINFEIITTDTYSELDKLLDENKIDIMIDNHYKKNRKNSIYDFAGNSVYIAGNKNSKDILENIDKVIINLDKSEKKQLAKIYYKYFTDDDGFFIIFAILFFATIISLMYIIVPIIKKGFIANKIKYRMDKGEYLLQYQPIYNPKEQEIIGFEGLLRLRGKDNKLIPPSEFVPEIENNNMLLDVSIWILKKAIEDYKKIENFSCVKGRNFYISINVSLDEIENDLFIEEVVRTLSNSRINRNRICLEIIERVKMNNIDKLIKNITLLKNAGFKIAIDDFGVEYSNLDIIEKLDVDVIKIDKSFVDGIGKDIIKNEIIMFIARIASFKNRAIVLEGVEEANQDNEIREMKNNLLYVQGYYYSKPIYLEQIAEL